MLYHIDLDYLVIKGNQTNIGKMPYFQGKLAVCRGFKSPSRYFKSLECSRLLFFCVAFFLSFMVCRKEAAGQIFVLRDVVPDVMIDYRKDG